MKDFAVVGSGIGGSSMAALLSSKGYDVALFEKEPYLGGCSSSFMHKGYTYNTGATTLAGYEDGYIVKDILDEIGVNPKVLETDPSIVIIQNSKTTCRYRDFELFFKDVDKNYPNDNNRTFWELIYNINKDFYMYKSHYYSNANIVSKINSLFSFIPLGLKFQKYLRTDAYTFINNFFEGIDKEYLEFLQAQIFIVAQAKTKEINFFTAALSLGYTFSKNHYVIGGFSKLFDDITKDVNEVHRRSQITKITKENGYFKLFTKNEHYKAKKVILNSTVYDSGKLFNDTQIKNYYKKYEKLNNFQSSFMLYMTIKSQKQFFHHYQIIEEKKFENTLSNALFVSFSDKEDNVIAPNGYYSITASIHTDSRFWEDKTTYKAQKKVLQDILTKLIQDKLDIKDEEIVQSFTATSKTFEHYISRSQLGGNAITMKNFLPFLPGNNTPIKDLYNVGDTVYAAQGWPGVMLGVKNLQRLLHV